MKHPQLGQVFELEGPPIHDDQKFGVAIHAHEDWRLGDPTSEYNEFENFDGVEPEMIGLVKYHEMKSFGDQYMNMSTDCYDTAYLHWHRDGYDTLFWLWFRFPNGLTYRFDGLITFSTMLEQELVLESRYRPAYYMVVANARKFMLDL